MLLPGFSSPALRTPESSTSSDPRQLLVRYCREGDQSAFTAFYRQQATRLWRFLVARGSTPDAAYDLLSTAFMRFTEAVCKDPRAPVALLYRIAVNAQIDSYRRRSASPIAYDGELAEQQPEAVSPPADEHEHVRALLKTLPPDEQNLLLLRYWIGLTHKEVAEILDLPQGTVRRRCAAALKLLRSRWEQPG